MGYVTSTLNRIYTLYIDGLCIKYFKSDIYIEPNIYSTHAGHSIFGNSRKLKDF